MGERIGSRKTDRDRAMMSDVWRAGVLALFGFVFLVSPIGGSSFADDKSQQFIGTWLGDGRINFKDGRNEAIKCRSYNTHREAELRLALRCASAAYKIEIRSKLKIEGDVIAGTWEERTFNAAGQVTGKVAGKALVLEVNGGGFKGDMTISRTDDLLAYSIETTGISLSGVAVDLRRIQ